jgi:Protein of unknown function (DUF2783)
LIKQQEVRSPCSLKGSKSAASIVMGKLITASQLPDPDAAYRAVIEAHRGLSDEASADLDARLVMVLVNHIGDPEVLAEAIALAKGAGDHGDRDGPPSHAVFDPLYEG